MSLSYMIGNLKAEENCYNSSELAESEIDSQTDYNKIFIKNYTFLDFVYQKFKCKFKSSSYFVIISRRKITGIQNWLLASRISRRTRRSRKIRRENREQLKGERFYAQHCRKNLTFGLT